MPKATVVHSFWKTSHKFAINNPDERGHQYTPLHTGILNAKLLWLSSNRTAKNPYAAQIMCFKSSSGTCIEVCTSDLLTEMISLVGREILVGQITIQHEEGHQNLIHRVVRELLRVMHLTLASGRGCRTQTGLPLMSKAEKHSFQPPVVHGLVLMVASVRKLVKRLHM